MGIKTELLTVAHSQKKTVVLGPVVIVSVYTYLGFLNFVNEHTFLSSENKLCKDFQETRSEQTRKR